MVVALGTTVTAAITTTICQSGADCECADDFVSCKKFVQDAPIGLPDNTTTVHFVDVLIKIFNNDTLSTGGRLRSVTWVSSNITSVDVLYFNELKHLDLSRNIISRLADSAFDHCPRLEYVDLSDNRLSTLSDTLFVNTKFLETVKIQNNIFHLIPENLFKESNNLRYLSVGNPNLSEIAKNAMTNLVKLQFLSIENSGIESINRSSFGKHTHLNTILLNNCIRLSTIDNELISLTPDITTIELNNCKTINFLPPSIVSLKNLKHLQLLDTEILPNCHNGWFGQWLNDTTTVVSNQNFTHFIEAINKLNCPARIYHISNSITLQLTKSGIIDCMAFGNPRPAITWLVPGGLTFHENKEADINITHHPKSHNWDLNKIDNQSILSHQNGSLHITRMLRNNIGKYTCYASNKYGNDSKTIEIHLDSEVFFNIKINALLMGITSALGFLMLTIMCWAFKLLLIRYSI